MSADIKLGGPTIFVVVSRATEWPFVIENDSDHTFTIHQMVCAFYHDPVYVLTFLDRISTVLKGGQAAEHRQPTR